MKNKKVVVAMSGGVDSSTAAALLKEQGYEVTGISLKLPGVGETTSKDVGCCGVRGIEDARRVAFRLGIPFYVLNYEKEFEKTIISEFCREYANGRTPNPCVSCNAEIKFGTLLKKARALGADYVATGHYARVKYNRATQRYELRKGKERKEQSYFLFSLSQRQLKYTLFPLAKYTKNEVRQIARNFGLPVSEKPGSQDICFIPDNNYTGFLRTKHPETVKPGPIIHISGKVLGEHNGIAFFTIGQRSGLKIAYGSPLYVVSINKKRNTIVVGGKDDVRKRELTADRLNWVGITRPAKAFRAKARIRYGHKEAEAIITPSGNGRVKIVFNRSQEAITPGQAVVFYRGTSVLGGGFIKSSNGR